MLALLIATGFVFLSSSTVARTAHAQIGQGNCAGMPPLASISTSGDIPPVDPVSLTSAPSVESPSGVAAVLQWPRVELPADVTAAGEPTCIAVWLKVPGGSYESQTERILPMDATEFVHTPVGSAGEYCYRFAVISGDLRSDFSEACFQLEDDQLPPGPQDVLTPSAPPAGQGLAPGGGANNWLALTAGSLIIAMAIPALIAARRKR